MKWWGAAAVAAAGAHGLVLETDKNRPVTKVINLLKDMAKQLETEAEEDQKIYDKMECWCKQGDKEKTASITEAESVISQMTATIEETAGKSSRLTAEIENLNKEVAHHQESLNTATALRKKELADFNAENKDLLQATTALKSAITVLKKHQALLQTDDQDDPNLKNVRLMLRHQMHKYKNLFTSSMDTRSLNVVQNFMQAAPYAAQSGEIFGILGNMLESMEADLAEAQKQEDTNSRNYAELKAAKEEEITAGQQQIDQKSDELAASDEKNANAKQTLEDTRASLSEDQKYLMMLREKCKQTDMEWAARQKTRADEQQAVQKALEFLTSDDAHDLFTRTFNPAEKFIQTRRQSDKQAKAAKYLQEVAKTHPRLAALSLRMKLDAFEKVKAEIDKMVAALLKEKQDEIKHRDYCINGLNENDQETATTQRDIEDSNAKIDNLTAQIKELEDQVKLLKEEVKEAQKQMKVAGEDREKQNAEFQKTVADQRATQKLLGQALTVLKGFYAKKAFLQQGPPPPAGFKDYKKSAGGNTVLSMIQQIIHDAKMSEAEALHDEEESQKTYEALVQDTNSTIKQKNKAIVNHQASKAQSEEDKTAEEKKLDNSETELKSLHNAASDLHQQCDFTIKNFDIRQTARDEEVEALRQAKAILSGSNFAAAP